MTNSPEVISSPVVPLWTHRFRAGISLALIAGFLTMMVGLLGCESRVEEVTQASVREIGDVGGLANADVSTLMVGTAVGDIALETTGVDSAGESLSLADYRGQVVVMEFWADW